MTNSKRVSLKKIITGQCLQGVVVRDQRSAKEKTLFPDRRGDL